MFARNVCNKNAEIGICKKRSAGLLQQEQSRNVGIIRLYSFLIWAISLIGEHTLKVRRLGTNAGGTQPIGLNSNFGSKTGLHDTGSASERLIMSQRKNVPSF